MAWREAEAKLAFHGKFSIRKGIKIRKVLCTHPKLKGLVQRAAKISLPRLLHSELLIGTLLSNRYKVSLKG